MFERVWAPGKLLLNAHNAHRNGSYIFRTGSNLSELHGAAAFEFHPDPAKKEDLKTRY